MPFIKKNEIPIPNFQFQRFIFCHSFFNQFTHQTAPQKTFCGSLEHNLSAKVSSPPFGSPKTHFIGSHKGSFCKFCYNLAKQCLQGSRCMQLSSINKQKGCLKIIKAFISAAEAIYGCYNDSCKLSTHYIF